MADELERRNNHTFGTPMSSKDIESSAEGVAGLSSTRARLNSKDHTNERSETAAAKENNYSKLRTTVLCILLWYFMGIGTVTTSKLIIVALPHTFMLSTIQFGISSSFALAYLYSTGQRRVLLSDAAKLTILTAGLYAFGFVFINLAMEYVPASFTETVRAMESLTTTILGAIFLKERPSLLTILTLVPICGGVAMSCNNTTAFNILGFASIALSNVCFSGRSVATKLIQQNWPDSYETMNFFADLSFYGFCLLVPVMLITEGADIHAYFATSIKPESIVAMSAAADHTSMVVLLLCNGIAFTTYNLMSYVILKRTDLITHSVVNVFRRVFTIFFTAVYFQVELNGANVTGVAVAVVGVLLFAYFKSSELKN